MKRIIMSLAVILIIISTIVLPVGAVSEIDLENETYLFDENMHTIDAPNPYILDYSITGEDFGIKEFGKIEDVEVALDGSIFISDSELSTIFKIGPDGSKSLYKEFFIGEELVTLNNPIGLFITYNNELYVADKGSRNVYVFDLEFNYIKKINPPSNEELFSKNLYEPLRVCVDTGNRVYVVSANQTQGILQFSKEGKFMGFLGAIRVSPTFRDILIRAIGTEGQKKSLLQLIPTEYNNLDIDEDSFIYGTINAIDAFDLKSEVTSKSGQNAPIMRINPKGKDVLLRLGRYSPVGDVNFLTYDPTKTQENVISDSPSIVDVSYYQNGIYTILDNKRGRLYTYNKSGELLFMFGGIGEEKDKFIAPTAVTYKGSDLVVADSASKSIKIFTTTEYTEKLYVAIDYHERGLYDQETEIWRQIEREYISSEMAYLGMGKAELSSGNYLEAMHCFQKADNKEYYSKAFKKYLKQIGYENITWIVLAAVVLIVIVVVTKIISKKKKRSEYNEPSTLLQRILFGKQLIFHPFKTFYDLKFLKIGTVASATVILAIVVVLTIIREATEPYLFRSSDNSNIMMQGFLGIVLIVGLFVLSNWCFTSLMDGNGTMKEIYIYTCYSLIPLLISTPLVTLLNQVFSLEEAAVLNFISSFSVIVVMFLLFIGTLVVHNYSPTKTVIMMVLTVIGMLILIFIALLCITLFQQIIIFAQNIIDELQLR